MSRLEEQVTAAILDGYRRIPPDQADDEWAEAATRAMIMEEPWLRDHNGTPRGKL